MLQLKTPIVFETLEELKEAVALGLKHKEAYLSGPLQCPIIQGVEHLDSKPIDINNIWSFIHCIDICHINDIYVPPEKWSDVRNEYTPVKMTLAQIKDALGLPNLVIVDEAQDKPQSKFKLGDIVQLTKEAFTALKVDKSIQHTAVVTNIALRDMATPLITVNNHLTAHRSSMGALPENLDEGWLELATQSNTKAHNDQNRTTTTSFTVFLG